MRNYSQCMLESMSNGIVTVDENGILRTCNAAGRRILGGRERDILEKDARVFFSDGNQWIYDKIQQVARTGNTEHIAEGNLITFYNQSTHLVNLTILPLVQAGADNENLGTMLVIEDISNEKRLMATMSRYVDPLLASRLLSDENDILGGQSTSATILFSDIRDFTALTEELGASGTVSLLNEYFSEMVTCIQNEGGILDKFIGDALMAAFGVPIPKGEDDDRAVRAAIAMLTRLRRWNKTRLDEGRKTVAIGIGINTETVIAGNIGAPRRMDYTLIGDGVNLASRVEKSTKTYGTPLLIELVPENRTGC